MSQWGSLFVCKKLVGLADRSLDRLRARAGSSGEREGWRRGWDSKSHAAKARLLPLGGQAPSRLRCTPVTP